jgi:predicted GNAT family acetyltransferase
MVGDEAPLRTAEVRVVDNRVASRFELQIDGEVAGVLTYEREGDRLSLLDMTTDPRRAGQGLGLVLVRQALDTISADRLSVLPVYPFVRDYIDRHPVYLDLVPTELRKRFQLPLDA